MTRFARPSKKTSLEATPWHELVSSGGNRGSTTASKDTSKTAGKKPKMADQNRKKNLNLNDGITEPKVTKKSKSRNFSNTGVDDKANVRTGFQKNVLNRKKIEMAGVKRKKDLNFDDYSIKPKIQKKSESKNLQSEGVKDKENTKTRFEKKGPKINRKRQGFNSKRDISERMTNKKFRQKGDMHKNVKKHKGKLPTDGNRKESLDKKHEARRKRRAKGKTCFHCRQTGHLVAECPMAQNTEIGVGNCYKCGSSEHTTKNCSSKATSDSKTDFPFAKCFICGESGHIARACPDNPKGLYPNGGGCKICGSVEHFRRDCPELVQKNQNKVTTTHAQYIKNKKGHYSADAELEDPGGTSPKVPKKKGPQVVKF